MQKVILIKNNWKKINSLFCRSEITLTITWCIFIFFKLMNNVIIDSYFILTPKNPKRSAKTQLVNQSMSP